MTTRSPSHPLTTRTTSLPVNWAVSICDDYDDATPRLQLMVEEIGAHGTGMVAHIDAERARRLRLAIRSALVEIGEEPGR